MTAQKVAFGKGSQEGTYKDCKALQIEKVVNVDYAPRVVQNQIPFPDWSTRIP
jgi:hypothetical protein